VTRNHRRGRLTVEKLGADCLDVRDLHRIGLLGDTWRTIRPWLRWPTVERMHGTRYLLRVELENQTIPQVIRVSWTRCHFGGARPWLHCPCCKRRVAKLFKGMGGYWCRTCVGSPLYASQSKSTLGRRHFEACRLRIRLGGTGSVAEPFPERPRGMHRTTYAQLLRRGAKLESGLSARLRTKPADYANLAYYFQS
jgi:hypothetical protein